MRAIERRAKEQRERGGLAGVIRAVVARVSSAALDLSSTAMDLRLAQESGEARFQLDVTARGDEPEIEDLRAHLERLKDDMFALADRWSEQESQLRGAYEEEFGETPSYAEPFIGSPPRYEDDVYAIMRLFLAPQLGSTTGPTSAEEDWYEHGRFLASALRYTLDRLRRYDALAAAAHGRRPPFSGHTLEWREDAGRWHLGGRPLHAGDPVWLLGNDHHGWIPGRCESGDGGRRVYFVFRLTESDGDLSVPLGEDHRLAWPSELE
jgi:hypothetical protein